jgi:hypothetical protein
MQEVERKFHSEYTSNEARLRVPISRIPSEEQSGQLVTRT